ncbi:MAG: helix-turn-helix transcriptional regulator, partial [Candidatus Dormibacteraeota bacterium]|nr:helix-turn-helix transcriptional regulator [Candidatus Dormibacteraeota bacterium]MBJ7601775.1 helix-turn-helix transcriptional regulator [Candidatus Dormibacteraeota bacterium]
VVAGVPAEHFFTQVQQLAVQGGVLVAIGVGGYLAILRLPEAGHDALFRLPPGFYSVASRRGAHATVGERVLGTSYLTQGQLSPPGERGLTNRLRRLLRDLPSDPSPELSRAADFFRLLGDQRRLRIVRLLMEGKRTAAEREKALGLSHLEMSYLLAELQRVRLVDLVEQSSEAGSTRYTVKDPLLRAGLADLLAIAVAWRPQAIGSPPVRPPRKVAQGGEGRPASEEKVDP